MAKSIVTGQSIFHRTRRSATWRKRPRRNDAALFIACSLASALSVASGCGRTEMSSSLPLLWTVALRQAPGERSPGPAEAQRAAQAEAQRATQVELRPPVVPKRPSLATSAPSTASCARTRLAPGACAVESVFLRGSVLMTAPLQAKAGERAGKGQVARAGARTKWVGKVAMVLVALLRKVERARWIRAGKPVEIPSCAA